MKPILCLDFDGVIHSYSSGWKGARAIPDDPVPGALEFIIGAMDHFEVHIFSSRSNYLFGRRAMKQWLRKHLEHLAWHEEQSAWMDFIWGRCADTWEPFHIILREEIDGLIRRIKWPLHKPPALLTIDDRALTFTGKWPTLDEIKSFKPWNKI
jgi:hypothetical protein